MMTQSVNWDYQWSQIVGRAWADDDFGQRLLADPAAVLTEYHLTPPAGLRVEVLRNPERVPDAEEGVLHLVLPAKPSAAELLEDDLCSVGNPVDAARCGCGGCGRCGGCVTACVWCY